MDAKRLLPRVQEEPTQPEVSRRTRQLCRRGVALVGIDPREADEAVGVAADRRGNRVVGVLEPVALRPQRTHDRAFDLGRVERPQQLVDGRCRPEKRLADEGEGVDGHVTAARIRSALPPVTRRSAAGSRPASRTFSSSMRGEHAGPSLA